MVSDEHSGRPQGGEETTKRCNTSATMMLEGPNQDQNNNLINNIKYIKNTTTTPTTTTTTTTTTTADDLDDDEVEVEAGNTTVPARQHQQQAPHHHHHHQGPLSETELDRLSELIKIIRQGSYSELLELLDSRRGFKNLLNIFYDGHTALHHSLLHHRGPDWCKQLIMSGANPNLSTLNGWHPFHLAAFYGPRETLCYLIEYFADLTEFDQT